MLNVNETIGNAANDLMKKYSLSHKLSLPDAFIAATALHHAIPIYTLNMKDFRFVTGLKFYKP